jgi:hypothetical protein
MPIHLFGELTVTFLAVSTNFLFVLLVEGWLSGCEDELQQGRCRFGIVAVNEFDFL